VIVWCKSAVVLTRVRFTRLGRDFTSEDDKPGAAPVAIISHSAWSRLFNNDANVVGRSVPECH
jgi:hypothetical protein